MTLVNLLIAVLCTEAITELLVHSEIFRPLREFISSIAGHLEKLFNCGYCLSFWIAWFLAILLAPTDGPCPHPFLNLTIWTLVIHRLSNFLNDFADRYLRENQNFLEEEEEVSDLDESLFQNADEFFETQKES